MKNKHMKKLFLTSSVDMVAADIGKKLDLTQRKLIFIITASEDETGDLSWRDDDRNALVKAGFDVTDYTFTGKTTTAIEQTLKQFDVICMEGGNTFFLLEQIQKSGCAEVIRQLVKNGMPYIGSSAGSIVAGPDIYPLRRLDDYDISHMSSFEGLGLVDFVVFPHWGSDHFKEMYLNKRLDINYNDDHKYVLLTDNQYIEIDGDTMRFIDVS